MMGSFVRLTLIALFLLLSGTAGAEEKPQGPTKIGKGVANAYYESCNSRDDQRMSDAAQDSLCSCSAARFMDIMTLEEVVAMKKEPGPGRVEYNKMLREVYGPCMQGPVEEVLYEECTNDRHVKEFMLRNTQRLCRCTAMRSADYLGTNGPEIMNRLLTQNPDMDDPMDYILSDSIFRRIAYGNLYECLRLSP